MNGRKNKSKNATPLKDWLGKKEKSEQVAFARDNYFPEEVGLEFQDFIAFFNQRKEILRHELKKVLAVTSEPDSEPAVEWNERNEEIETPESGVAVETSE